MNQTLSQLETSAAFGLYWPTWLAVAGIAVFCLLGLYAGFLFFADQRLMARFRFLLPATLRGRIMLSITLAAMLPTISLALVLMERTANERLNRSADLMKSQVTNFAGMADYFLDQRITKLEASAADIDLDIEASPEAQQSLEQIYLASPGFLSLLLVDTDGLAIASAGSGTMNIEPLPVDTGYLRKPLKSGMTFLSGITHPPGNDVTTTAAISIPVKDNTGSVTGMLVGYFSFSGFRRMQSPLLTRSNIEPILLDGNGKVLYSGKSVGTLMSQDLIDQSLLAESYAGDDKLFSFTRPASDAGPLRRYLATGQTLRSGWRIYLIQPLEGLERAMLGEYQVALAWLGGALIISICLALAMVSGISGPLESLDRSLREFDLNALRNRTTPPAAAPLEVRSIFKHLGELEERMLSTYNRLRKALTQGEKLRGELIYVISNREKEIETRTEELKEANSTLERLSREDSLTGLANRRWFAQFLTQTWRSALRDNKAISILLIDIDDFKSYNDTYGHQKGDDCLKLVAQAIHRTVGRASDLVSRYGGEEFVVVLGDTPLEGALQIAEQIRAAVESLHIPHKAAKFHRNITLSIGVTSTLPTHDSQPETILIAADRAMYNAKRDGKNRVAFSTAARTGTYQSLIVSNDAPTRPS